MENFKLHERDPRHAILSAGSAWIRDDLSGLLYCRFCGNDAPLDTTGPSQYESTYCPTCGAYMKGGA